MYGTAAQLLGGALSRRQWLGLMRANDRLLPAQTVVASVASWLRLDPPAADPQCNSLLRSAGNAVADGLLRLAPLTLPDVAPSLHTREAALQLKLLQRLVHCGPAFTSSKPSSFRSDSSSRRTSR